MREASGRRPFAEPRNLLYDGSLAEWAPPTRIAYTNPSREIRAVSCADKRSWAGRKFCGTEGENHGSNLPGDRSHSRLRTQHFALAPTHQASLRPECAE